MGGGQKGEAEKVVGFIHAVNLVGHTGAKESEGDGEKGEICRKRERENCKFTQYCYSCVKELAFSVPLKNYVVVFWYMSMTFSYIHHCSVQ